MEELAHLIEVYKSVDAALLIRENLDAIEISELIKETINLRTDPTGSKKNREELIEDWEEFKNSNALNEEIIVDGKVTTINELMTF